MNNQITPLQAAKSRNQRQPCQARDCTRSRGGLALYCNYHQHAVTRYGHPLQGPVKRAQYAWATEKVQALFKANASHPGLVAALQWVTSWMAAALEATDPSTVATIDLQRIEAHGVKPIDVLREVTAIFVWSAFNPQAFHSDKAVTYAMSHAVCRLAPKERRIGRLSGKAMSVPYRQEALRNIGAQFRKVLPGFLAGILVAIEDEQKQLDGLKAAFRSPFLPPASLLAKAVEPATQHHQQ